MEKTFKRIANYNVSVKEIAGKVVFVRKLVRGGSQHSFGIHVAKIAGMPSTIVSRANEVLKILEDNNSGNSESMHKNLAEVGSSTPGMQLSFFQLEDPVLCQVRDEILHVDINNLTPVEALNKLNEIKKIITGKG
jgi:DNA mismatch repair protein MutS